MIKPVVKILVFTMFCFLFGCNYTVEESSLKGERKKPLVSCSGDMYTTNDLKSLNLKGNVKKVELITQTPIPVSEWFYTGINFSDYSRKCRKNAVYTFVGNSAVNFNESGRIISQIVYSNDGSVLFEKLPFCEDRLTLYQPINIKVNELLDGWKFEFDDSGRVVRQMTKHDGKLFLDRKITYTENGNIAMVICNYSGLNMDEIDYYPTDTTFFTYSKTDSIGNWTEAVIEHRGLSNTDSYVMNIKRQITYFGEDDKEPLIEGIKSWNEEQEASYPQEPSTFTVENFFGNSISISIPSQMEVSTTYNVPNSLLYQLPNAKGFFNLTITKMKQNESIFDNEESPDLYDAMSYMLGQNGVVVMKWLGFSNKELINNQKSLMYGYCFYATGGYLNTGDPIITEEYDFQPNNGNTVYSVAVGYDSYHAYLYKPWAEIIKNSITINY